MKNGRTKIRGRIKIGALILVLVGFALLVGFAVLMAWRTTATLAVANHPSGVGSDTPPAVATRSAQPDTLPEPVTLTDAQDNYPLGLHMQILEDSGGKLTIDDVSSPAFDARFIPSRVAAPGFGYTESAYWIRFRLRNEASPLRRWVTQVQFPNMHFVDFYSPRADGEGFTLKQTGVMRPLSSRDLLVPWSVFRLALASPADEMYYVRLQTGSAMQIAMSVWEEGAFLSYAVRQQLWFGLFLGALLGLMAYNLFVLFYIRDVKYLYIALILGGILLQEAARAGYTELYLIPGLYEFKKYYHAIPLMIAFAGMVVFSDSLLEMKRLQPLVHRANQIVVGGFVLLALASPWLSYAQLSSYTLFWAVASLLVGCLGGVMSWRGNVGASRLLLVAWIAMVTALYGVVLTRFGVFPSTLATENAYRVAFVVLGTSSSIALATRVSSLRAATETASHDLENARARQFQVLEAMPLGVAVYGADLKAQYANRRIIELLRDPTRIIQLDLAFGRSLPNAIRNFSLRRAGTDEDYPLEETPVYRALQGEPASADDIEMEQGGLLMQLAAWASPIRDESGHVDSAVLVLDDITDRKRIEGELRLHRQHLQELVEARAAELSLANRELQLHLDWLNAISRVNEMVTRTSDFNEVYERLGKITTGLFGSRDAFLAEWDGSTRQVKVLTHSCRYEEHLVPPGSISRLPAKVFVADGSSAQHPASLSVVWGEELREVDGALGDHLRATKTTSIALVSMPVHGQVMGFLGLEMPAESTFTTSRETSLLRAYSVDIARVIENARLFEQAKTVAAIEERNRLARELHDSVAQGLFGISLFTDATRMALASRKLDVVRGHVEELAALSHQALLDMRLLIFELRPPILETAGLAFALRSRLESVEAKAGVETVFESQGEINLAPETEAELYRIAQEALTNVTKYARAHRVDVRLIEEAGIVRLTVEDDGVGFDTETAEKRGGQGFRGMRERAERIGAELHIESGAGGGSRITVEVKQ
jgi:signal transduction histidine kinase